MATSQGKANSNQKYCFFLHIGGLSVYCSWRDLKDRLRSIAPHIGWTRVELDPQQPSTQRGWVRVSDREEADNLFEFLERDHSWNGRPIIVHYFDITTSPPIFLKTNTEPDRVAREYEQTNATMLSELNNYMFYPGSYQSTPQFSPEHHQYAWNSPQEMDIGTTTHIPFLAENKSRWPEAHSSNESAETSTSDINKSPVMSAALTRSIFIKGLNYSTKVKDLENLLYQAGPVDACDIHHRSSTGVSRGTATAQYRAVEDAAKAIWMFNGVEFQGRRIEVRPDKNEATRAICIVDGAYHG